MEQLNNDILPCLKAVGPWWTNEDRRLLFCHLLSIFDFDADYLATIPSLVHYDSDNSNLLDVASIDSDYRLFKKSLSTKKINCLCIRKISLSFGKFNHRLCFLCPYSTTYKNSNIYNESKFLYRLIKQKEVSFDTYMSTTDNNISTLFKSYFPFYINNILIDAYPFELIADKFSGLAPGYFLDEPQISRQFIVNKLYEDLKHKFSYSRVKPYLQSFYPELNPKIYDSAFYTIKSIEIEFYNLRPVNLRGINCLFDSLSEELKYKPKPVTQYLSVVLEPVTPDIFTNKLISKEDELKKIDNLYDFPSNIDNFIEQAIDSQLSALPSYDDNFLSIDFEKSLMDSLIQADQRISMDTLTDSHDIHHINDIPELSTDVSIFLKYYPLYKKNNIYILGLDSSEDADSLFTAMISDTAFLCMEPCLFENEEGMLISNDTNDLLFYSFIRLGHRLLRKISDFKIPVYTSNLYHTGLALFSNRIFYLDLKDIGVAAFITSNNVAKGIRDLTETSFPDCLLEYYKLYYELTNDLSEDTLKLLSLNEKYKLIHCIAGTKPPFSNLESLYDTNDAVNITYNFSNDIKPTINGLFLSLSAYLNEHIIDDNLLIGLYKELCIKIYEQFSLTSNQLYLLNLSKSGILFYLIGSKRQIQKMRLFFSACARRVFSKYSTNGNPITFEEKTLIFENTIDLEKTS